jgi:hypothetical protein
MDPGLMPAFWPVAAAIDWICIIYHVHFTVTVFDRMNLFSVHDQAAQPIAIRENSFEKSLEPIININYVNDMHNANNVYIVYNVYNAYNSKIPVRELIMMMSSKGFVIRYNCNAGGHDPTSGSKIIRNNSKTNSK